MEKRLLVDIDALAYKTPPTCCDDGGWCLYLTGDWKPKENQKTELTEIPQESLEKLFIQKWRITLWTVKPKQHYTEILSKIQDSWNFWYLIDPKLTLLIRTPNKGEDQVKTKLSLLEENFGKHLDKNELIVTVESSDSWSKLLEEYTSNRVVSHTANTFWFDLKSIDKLDSYLYTKNVTQ